MPLYPSARILGIVLISLFGASLGGCVVYDRPYNSGYVHTMPSAGIAYYDYWYYPGVEVYYDVNRHVYFYLSSSGWVQVQVLPPTLRARLGRYVPIHSRYDRPYMEHGEHRRSYPQNYYQPPLKQVPEQHYYQPPLKKVPEQDRYIPRRDNDDSRRYVPPRSYEAPRREDRRERQYYPPAPQKKAAPEHKTNSQGRDNSGKSDKDRKQNPSRDTKSERRQNRDDKSDRDRDQRDYR